jgi:hypothetical protein
MGGEGVEQPSFFRPDDRGGHPRYHGIKDPFNNHHFTVLHGMVNNVIFVRKIDDYIRPQRKVRKRPFAAGGGTKANNAKFNSASVLQNLHK